MHKIIHFSELMSYISLKCMKKDAFQRAKLISAAKTA